MLASYYVSRNVWLLLARSVPKTVLDPYRSRIGAYHLGRFVRTIRHLREPAARASLRGSMVGFLLWSIALRNQPVAEPATVSTLRDVLTR